MTSIGQPGHRAAGRGRGRDVQYINVRAIVTRSNRKTLGHGNTHARTDAPSPRLMLGSGFVRCMWMW